MAESLLSAGQHPARQNQEVEAAAKSLLLRLLLRLRLRLHSHCVRPRLTMQEQRGECSLCPPDGKHSSRRCGRPQSSKPSAPCKSARTSCTRSQVRSEAVLGRLRLCRCRPRRQRFCGFRYRELCRHTTGSRRRQPRGKQHRPYLMCFHQLEHCANRSRGSQDSRSCERSWQRTP